MECRIGGEECPDKDSCPLDTSFLSNEGLIPEETPLVFLYPSRGMARQVPRSAHTCDEEVPCGQWYEFAWSPCGQLLLAK